MNKAKILVVDDDKNLLELMHMRLEASGYGVVSVDHENKAKEVVSKKFFDTAIVDLQLVNQDGIQLMEELHLIQPEMPVIILTAHGSIESAVEAMKRGAFTYLTKPFEARELQIRTKNLIEQRRKLRKKFS